MAHYQQGSDFKQQEFQDAARLKEKVEIYITCRDLLNKDLLSLSDPFVVGMFAIISFCIFFFCNILAPVAVILHIAVRNKRIYTRYLGT